MGANIFVRPIICPVAVPPSNTPTPLYSVQYTVYDSQNTTPGLWQRIVRSHVSSGCFVTLVITEAKLVNTETVLGITEAKLVNLETVLGITEAKLVITE